MISDFTVQLAPQKNKGKLSVTSISKKFLVLCKMTPGGQSGSLVHTRSKIVEGDVAEQYEIISERAFLTSSVCVFKKSFITYPIQYSMRIEKKIRMLFQKLFQPIVGRLSKCGQASYATYAFFCPQVGIPLMANNLNKNG